MPYKDKEKEKEYKRLYFQKNKEKNKEKIKINKENFKEKNPDYAKNYYEENKEKLLKQNRERIQKNKVLTIPLTEEEKEQKRKLSQDKYREKNKEELNRKSRKRKKTETGKKQMFKDKWKRRGLNMENFEEIYERYKDAIFCDICECVLEGIGNNRKCMDHCHITGEFRNVVCHHCNVTICK